MHTLANTEGAQGYKERSVLPSTYPKGSIILNHLFPVVSGTAEEVIQSSSSLQARRLIWRSTHPGDGEGLIGIMPSGQAPEDIEPSAAVLAFFDVPQYFTSLAISEKTRDALRCIFYDEHRHADRINRRDIGLTGMSRELIRQYPQEVGCITELFASQIRWIVAPFSEGENLTLTEHPNMDGFRIDPMGYVNYGAMLHYSAHAYNYAAIPREPIMVMTDGAYIGQECRSIDPTSAEHTLIQMAKELINAVRESGVYPSDVCLQIECGIPKKDAERAYLFQVRKIGPRYRDGALSNDKNAMFNWQFGPSIPALTNTEITYPWELNEGYGADLLSTHKVTLKDSSIWPLGYPPAYTAIGGLRVVCGQNQISFAHNLSRWLNWAARGGEHGPGTFEQLDRGAYEQQQGQFKNTSPRKDETNITRQFESVLLPNERDFLRLLQARQSKQPHTPKKEPTPREKALITRHAPLFEEKNVLPYAECMELLGEVFDLGRVIPLSYFGDSYGGSRLELHNYTPRQKLISDEQWSEKHNYKRPYYAIDYDRPEFCDEESVRIMFDRTDVLYPKILFAWRELSLEINLQQEFMHFCSDHCFIENEGGYKTGTIIYGFCPEDASGERSIANAQHVFGNECQKTHAYYRYLHPPYRRIGIREGIKRMWYGDPVRPAFTGERYVSHSAETLTQASDLLGPMLQRLRDALHITLHTDPSTFVSPRLLRLDDGVAYLKRVLEDIKNVRCFSICHGEDINSPQ